MLSTHGLSVRGLVCVSLSQSRQRHTTTTTARTLSCVCVCVKVGPKERSGPETPHENTHNCGERSSGAENTKSVFQKNLKDIHTHSFSPLKPFSVHPAHRQVSLSRPAVHCRAVLPPAVPERAVSRRA